MFDNNNQNGTESQGFESQNNSFSESGVENVTKKSGKGKKVAIISGITAAVVVGGGAAAYACSDFVKNQVKLHTMKPENYYAWVWEENSENFAKSVSEGYKKGLDNYGKGQSSSAYLTYDVSDDVKDLLISEVEDMDDDDADTLIDVIENIDSIKVGADIKQKKLLASYAAYAQVNDENIISVEAVQDMDNFDFFIRIPELTEKWIGAELGEYIEDASGELRMIGGDIDYLELYKDILENPEKYLSPDDVEKEISRYVGVWTSTMNNVRLEKKEEIDICDISVNYTVAKVKINEKTADKLALNMLKELKNDEIVKKLVTDKLGLIEKDDYKENIQNLIDELKEEIDDKDYDNKDAVSFKTFIDAKGVIRGFKVDIDDESVFAAFGKDGKEVRGEFYVKNGKEKGVSAELTATESGKKYDGQIDVDIPHTEYDDDWNPTTTFETYTLTFEDFEIVDEEKGYINADISIIIPDIDPIDLEFKSSGKEQEISYNIVFDDTDYGKITFGFSSDNSAKIERPDTDDALIVDFENFEDVDIRSYVSEDEITDWVIDVLEKLGFSDDFIDELIDSLPEDFLDDIGSLGDDWDDDDWDDDDWDYDDDDYDWDYDDDDDYDWDDDDDDYGFNSSSVTGVEVAEGEAYISIDDNDYNYYMGYKTDPLSGNAKNVKISGDGEYTVSVTANSDTFKDYTSKDKANGIYSLELCAYGVEGIGDADVTIKSIKIDGTNVPILQQPVENYSYGDTLDLELYYKNYDDEAVFSGSAVGEWQTIEITFEVKGLK